MRMINLELFKSQVTLKGKAEKIFYVLLQK